MMKGIFIVAIVLACTVIGIAQKGERVFTGSLGQEKCSYLSTGSNRYFILQPGYQLTLENGKGARLVVTVLNETRKIGAVETRVVEENESKDGKTVEVSRNFLAYCRQNGSIYYFGEEVDTYRDGKLSGHGGAWLATGNNSAGVLMPGQTFLGARYYQEIAPGVAMDRAEIVKLDEKVTTPAGNFADCLVTEETTPLEAGEKEYKYYAPGIGLIRDEDLELVKYGFIDGGGEIDALKASPGQFKLLFENVLVRVLEYSLRPGEKDQWHTHPPKSSYVVSGGKLHITLENGQTFDVDEVTGSASWMGYLGKHSVENIGNTTVTVILTEVK